MSISGNILEFLLELFCSEIAPNVIAYNLRDS